MQGLGSLAGVAKEKLSLIAGMPEAAPLFLNNDDEILRDVQIGTHDVRRFGLDSTVGFVPCGVSVEPDACTLSFGDGHDVRVGMGGRHNALNLLAAVAVARSLGLTPSSIQAGAAQIVAPSLRMERVAVNGWDITLDCYNANPASMMAALDAFSAEGCTSEGRRVLLLGDMLELGAASQELHGDLGSRLAEMQPALVLLVGDQMRVTGQFAVDGGLDPRRVQHFSTADKHRALDRLCPGDRVLVKGSRGLALEDLFVQSCEGLS